MRARSSSGEVALEVAIRVKGESSKQESAKPGDRPDTAAADETNMEREPLVRCRRCDFGLAKMSDRATRRDEHRHMCVNPSGIPYEIGCYERAGGATEVGEREEFWSWFAGYSWRVLVCTECREHVGWSFRNADDTFVGLITSRTYESRG